MEFVILGPTALHVDGRSVPLGPAKQRGMLALLLYHAGDAVRVETIVDHLWPDHRLVDRRAQLYPLVSRLRAILKDVGLTDSLGWVRSVGAYRLDVDPVVVDFHRFRRALGEARLAAKRGHPDSSVALLSAAMSLWRDEPLADLRGAGAEQLRRRMKDLQLDAYRLLIDSQIRLGNHHSALSWLEPLVQTYDTDEAIARYWMAALTATGREDDARAFYLAFRRRFRREMHLDPTIDFPGDPSRSSRAGGTPRTAPGSVGQPTRQGPDQLPKDIGDFVGRAELIDELDSIVDGSVTASNVIVVNGMPGSGKTTLAIHWAHRRRHHFPDGILYIDANGYGPSPPVPPEEALGGFLRALGVPTDRMPIGVEQRRERLNQVLGGKRLLIVIDNARDSAQTRPLIPTSPTCATIVTSRSRLTGLAVREGIRWIAVQPLPDHDSATLLRQLVGTARANAAPAALEALVRFSDGLPLALRIIGQHIAERPRASIGDLVDELTTNLLNAEGEEEDDANLITVFTWSYNALKPEGARLFRILGLYPGSPISVGAAAAMLKVPGQQVEQLLNTIAKAHLISHDVARRYRFHDLLRRYAAMRSCREDPDQQRREAMRRLLDWFLLSAANAATLLAPHRQPVPELPSEIDVEPETFVTEAAAMKWCEAERANLGAATRWAAQNGFYRHGWQIPGAVHEIFERYGRQDDVLELQQLAVDSARLDGNRVAEVGSLNNLGTTYFALHDYPRAAASFGSGQDLARRIRHVEGEAVCSHNLASVHLQVGRVATAAKIYTDVLVLCRTHSHPSGEAAALHRLGSVARAEGRYSDAVGYLHSALSIRERIGSLRGQGVSYAALAELYLEMRQPELALTHCRRALDIHDSTNDQGGRCDVLTTLADVQRERLAYHDAIREGQRAVAVSDEIADSQRRCRALTVLAHTFAAAGNEGTARRLRAEALSILGDLPDPDVATLRARLEDLASLINVPTSSTGDGTAG